MTTFRRVAFKYRFELLIPLYHNDGTAVDNQLFFEIQQTLVQRFGGARVQPMNPFLGWYTAEQFLWRDRATPLLDNL